MGLLDGKVALITGAARGQGRSHAERFAAEGADIIAIDVGRDLAEVPYAMATEDDLAETARLVQERGRRVVTETADVRDFEALDAAVARGVAEFGRIDIAIANAGVVVQELGVPSWELSEERWDVLIDTNLTGVFHTLKAAVPTMIAGGRGGSIVITSSTAGLKGMRNMADYVASKHAVVGVMRTFAQELAPHSIRVNTVHPTGVATPMVQNEMMDYVVANSPELAETFANMLPVELLEPSDITDAVLFLVSDAGKYVTGTMQVIDGGASQK